MATFSCRLIGGLRIFSILIFFTGLVVRTTYGTCSTVVNCDVCTDTNICTSCSLKYGLTTSQPPTCQPCATNCQLCAQNGARQCDTGQCISGYLLNKNNTCKACSDLNCADCYYDSLSLLDYCYTCKPGFYRNASLYTGNHVCLPCSGSVTNCASCDYYSTWNTDLCTSCIAGYYINSTISPTTNKCLRCASNCQTCYGGAYSCYDCIPGFGRVVGTLFCAPCRIKFCQTCSSNQNNTCTQCQAGYQLNSVGQDIVCTPASADSREVSTSINTVALLVVVIVFAVLSGLTLIAFTVVTVKLCQHIKSSRPQGQDSQETPKNNYSTSDANKQAITTRQLPRVPEYQTLEHAQARKTLDHAPGRKNHDNDASVPVVYDDIGMGNVRNQRK